MQKQTFLWIGVALLIAVGIGYSNIRRDTAIENSGTTPLVAETDNNTQKGLQTADKDSKDDVFAAEDDAQKNEAPQVLQLPASNDTLNAQVPSLNKVITFSGDFSEEQKEVIRNQVAILTDALAANLDSFNNWIDLALLAKSAGDYEWARDIWEYAGIIRPENALSFANLGMLYGYYLKEPLKAEANFLHSIENEPRFIEYYAKMTDFYLEVMNDKGKAVDFLDRAIAKYSEWEELKGLREYVGD